MMCSIAGVMTAPDSLPTDPDALRALLLAERMRHAEELAAARNEAERLVAIIKELQRHRFGRRSEQLDPDQLALSLEDLEQTLAAAEVAAEKDGTTRQKKAAPRRRQNNRGALPPHLPREEIVIDVEDKTCACCGGLKHRIGEDVAERLDVIPAQLKVIVTRRPKYACRACAGEVAAPECNGDRRALEAPVEGEPEASGGRGCRKCSKCRKVVRVPRVGSFLHFLHFVHGAKVTIPQA
jgi:transposase